MYESFVCHSTLIKGSYGILSEVVKSVLREEEAMLHNVDSDTALQTTVQLASPPLLVTYAAKLSLVTILSPGIHDNSR